MILLFLIMRRTPTIRELIVATPLSLSSPSATGLSARAPAQRAGAQRLRATTRCCPSRTTPWTGGKREKADFAEGTGCARQTLRSHQRVFGQDIRTTVTLRPRGDSE
jgi:hypothetical protein